MRCQRAQQRLMAYHDSELSPGAGRRLEKHLESCDECSQLLERLRLADHHATSAVGFDETARVPGMPSPDDRYWVNFTARVLDRVEEDAAIRAPEKRKPKRNWDLMIPKMAPVFSIALVVVVAAGVLMKLKGPTPVSKAPAVLTEAAPDRDVLLKDREAPLDGPAVGDRGHYAAAPAEKARENESAYSSVPAPSTAPLPEAKTAAAIEKEDTAAIDMAKRTALAEPVSGSQVNEDRELITAEPGAVRTLEPEAKAGEPLPLSAAMVEEPDISRDKMEEASQEALPEGRVGQTEGSAVGAETTRVEEIAAAAPAVMETAVREDDRTQEPAEVSPATPVDTFKAPAPEIDDNIMVREGVSTITGRETFAEQPADTVVQSVKEQEERSGEVELLTSAQPPEEGEAVRSGMETLGSSVPSQEARQAFSSKLPPYRGPEDQLVHARNLAEVRKFWESEQVLKDLLSQDPPTPIQEEASLLLVKVLSGQNRVMEAQQVLEDAKIQFPESEPVQTYEIKSMGDKPVQ